MDAAPLVQGDTIGIDAMTLDACEAWLTRLAEASGITAPTRTERARFSKAQEEGVQWRLDSPAWSRRRDRENEERAHASGPRRRACGGPGDRDHRGRDHAGCGVGDTITLVETFTRATTKQAVSPNRRRIRGARGYRMRNGW